MGSKVETRVVLLRHAETSAPDRFHGSESDIGLGERGHAQARAVASHLAALAPGALASSAMRRAIESLTPAAEACRLVPERIEALHERRMGPLSGATRAYGRAAYEATMARWMAGDLAYTHAGGESYSQIRDRALPAFLDLADRHSGGTVVVVCHGVVIRVLLTSLLAAVPLDRFDRVGIDFMAFNDLRFVGGDWRAECLNRIVA
jgi:probable phosphoglycerate mutase